MRQVLAGPLERTSHDALHPLAHLFGNQLLSPQKPSAPRLNDRKATSERGQKTSGGGGGNVRRRIRSQRPTASRPGPFPSPSRPATRPAGIRKKKRTNGGATAIADLTQPVSSLDFAAFVGLGGELAFCFHSPGRTPTSNPGGMWKRMATAKTWMTTVLLLLAISSDRLGTTH